MKYDDIFQMVGHTPHIRVCAPTAPAANIYIKLEGCNPSGSIKDRACVLIIRDMLERGALQPGMTILDASSGNMACAIAFYGRMVGYATTVVVNSKLTADKRNFIQYYGARLLQVGDYTIEGNRYCQKLVEQEPGVFCFLDQLHNWANPRAHYETTGPEILVDFPRVAMVVGSLGSGGSLLGVAQFLKEKLPNVIVVAVQASAGTKIPGTGSFDDGDYITPFIRKGMNERIFDHVVKISEPEAIERTLQLRDQAIFCGLQTGGVLHAALASIRELSVEGDIVMLSGDSGWKNMDKLLSIDPPR
jgi:[CysO sulfur-carrier protein]-thiocarboxylate-dependent cysteine synthase